MLNITSLSIKNFLSVGNATQALRLDQSGLTLIIGNNSDANGGITKNGAGKSTIVQALSFALYGQPLTKIKVDNLINNINTKGMFVVVEFEKDDIPYRIERGRRPNILKVYKNGEEMKEDGDSDSKGENKETNIDIAGLIGMSHTMFKHIVALNTYTEPFLKLGAALQREVIEELLGVTQISARADLLKELIGHTKDEIKSEDAYLVASKASNARIERAIETAQQDAERWDIKHTRTVSDIVEQMSAMETIDFDAELKTFDDLDRWRKSVRVLQGDRQYLEKDKMAIERDIARTVVDHKRAVSEMDGSGSQSAIERLGRDLARVQGNIASVEKNILEADKEIVRLEEALAAPGDQECKTCSQPLRGTDHLAHVVERLTQDRDRRVISQKELRKEVASMVSDADEIEHDIASRTIEAQTIKDTAGDKIVKIDAESATLAVQLSEKRSLIEQIDLDLKILGKQPVSLFDTRDEVYTAKHARETLANDLARETATENPFKGQEQGLRGTLQKIDMTALNDAHDLLRHQDFLMKLLTSKDSFIRRKIIEQNLHYLNVRLNHYLGKLGLPHEVVFQSDLGVEIMMLGREMDFAQLSRGEGNRVILSVSWAFRDVWESLNNRVNLIFIDEQLDSGIDSHGAEAGIQILKSFGRSGRNVFLISHRDELAGRIDQTMLVSKIDGFTSISMDT